MEAVERRNDPLRRCFIVAHTGAESARIVEALNERGIECLVPDEIAKSGTLSEELLNDLAAADFVVASLHGKISPNLAFELGAAYASRKPTLIFTSNFDALFRDLHGMYIVNASPGSMQELGPDIDRFLRYSAKASFLRQEALPSRSSHGDFTWARDQLVALRQEPGPGRAAAFEHLIERVFREAGAQVVEVQPLRPDGGTDLIVWQNDIAFATGGPIIVQCKYYGGSTGSVLVNAKETAKRLENLVSGSDARLALLIIDHDRRALPFQGFETAHVLSFGADQLIDFVERGVFADEVLRRRRRMSSKQKNPVEPN